jgi:ATP-dependent Lon protease
MRQVRRENSEDGGEHVTVTKKNLDSFLGLPKRSESDVSRKDAVGVVTAWHGLL